MNIKGTLELPLLDNDEINRLPNALSEFIFETLLNDVKGRLLEEAQKEKEEASAQAHDRG